MTTKSKSQSLGLVKTNPNLQSLLGHVDSRMMMTVWNREGQYLSVWISKVLIDLYGVENSDLVDKHLHELYSISESERMLRHFRKTLDAKKPSRIICHFTTHRGDFWLDTTLIPSTHHSAQPVIIGLTHDITNLREEEVALQSQGMSFSCMVSQSYGYLISDKDGNVMEVNDRFCQFLGDDSKEALKKRIANVKDFIAPVSQTKEQFWSLFFKTTNNHVLVDIPKVDKTSKRFILFRYGGGNTSNQGVEIHCIFKDPELILPRNYSSRTDEAFLLSVLAHFPDKAITVCDRNGLVVSSWTPTDTALEYAMASKNYVGKYLRDIFPEKEARRKIAIVKKVIDTTETYVEEQMKQIQGTISWYEVTVSKMTTSSGEDFAIFATIDITDRKYAEKERQRALQELHQAQKMEAVGRIASGVAHEFGNRLSIILGYASVLRETIRDKPEIQHQLDTLIQSTQQASSLTKHLLTFSRNDVYQDSVLNLHTCMNTVMNTLHNRLVNRHIDVRKAFAADQVMVLADSTQIQNIILNLILNAMDAMPGGGKLSISTSNSTITGKESDLQAFSLAPGQYINIRIEDSGNGIAKEQLPQIFEPFYTTKSGGHRTGLGLTIANRVVTHYKGAITVESKLKIGTSFSIKLPILNIIRENQIADQKTSRMIRGEGNILIVDDEPAVLEMMADCLQTAGYSVNICEDPVEALRLVHENKDNLDLVVLDVVMPVMSGHDLFLAIRKIVPTLKVMITSAYSKSGSIDDMLNAGAVGFIEKPATAAYLTKSVADALSRVIPRKND